MNWLLDTAPFPSLTNCPGPLLAFESAPVYCDFHGEEHPGAVLFCPSCGEIFTSGGYLDRSHAKAELVWETE